MQAIQPLGTILRLFAYFILAQGITAILLPLIGNHPISTYSNITSIQTLPDLFRTVAFSDMIGKIIGFILLPLVYLKVSKQENTNPFIQDKRIPFDSLSIILGITALLLSLPSITLLAELNQNIHLPESLSSLEKSLRSTEKLAGELTMLFVRVDTPADIALSFVAIAIIPAIGEEIIFRGFCQRELIQQTRNVHLSVWITACIFSFIHFQFLGFFPRVLLGALLGYMYVWSGSLLVPILMHFTNNALTLILLMTYKKGYSNFNPESSEEIPYVFVFLTLSACIAILYNRKKTYDNHLSNYITNTHE
ncbi:CPBP family intramembrane glutamic endopeptidase [Cytophaga aurantiaca]|uniref:CPBP family intramembrane glutamic endopeptidase n=1 Tax=Cytophaga aurantiaca TaxID=29530 RepID=UPI00037FA85E|nr:CPBP family intramembrane glutamic endopeptidase [Cytophaga aurantiaca]